MPQLINNIDSFFKEFPQTVFKRMGLITIGLDTKGDIQYANPYLLKITGYTRKEVINKNWFSLFIPEDKQENINNVQAEVLEKDLRSHHINDILTKDGRTLTISWNNTQIKNPKGDSIGTLSIGADITKHKKAEAELQHQLKELTALHCIATAGSRAKSVDELIELTTQILGDTLYSDNFGLVLMNQDGQTLTPHPSYRGIPAESMKIEQSIETGICGRAVRSGKPQRVSDTSKDRDYIMLKADTCSELTVPLYVNERTFGVINAESTQINAFSEKDEQLLTTFANQLTIAIEKSQLFESTQRQTREITALYDTALATSNILDTQELIHQLYEQIKNLFPLDTFLLTTYDRQAEEITVTYIMEEGQELQDWIGQKFPIQESGLIGWVTRNQESLLVRDMQVEKLPVKPKHSANPARSWLGVPLTARGSTIGAISVQSFTPNVFDQNHQRLLESITSQVAVTLENSRLVEQTRTSLEQLSALHDIDLVINSSLDLRVTLNILLDQVIEKLDVNASAVLLLNPHSKMLEYAAGRGFQLPLD
ncbi:MAG TPA: GAF domain-containing protein [Anaerolineae bacterium]|nr:GAF domain-containing protein [Anaerolineae bacterium]